MNGGDLAVIDPRTRKRNRVLLIALIIVALGMAVYGTLYLRYFGFNLEPTKEQFH